MTSPIREAIRSTHPFMDFTFDLRRLSYPDWLLLGEAASKSEHLASVALLPETAARLQRHQLVRGVLGTAAIEGNTLTADEVERHLEGRLNLPRSRDYLGREIDNIVRLCNEELALLNTGAERRLSADTIAELNRGILEGLPVAENAEPGRYRRHRVGVGRYLALPPELARDATQEMCDWLYDGAARARVNRTLPPLRPLTPAGPRRSARRRPVAGEPSRCHAHPRTSLLCATRSSRRLCSWPSSPVAPAATC